MYVSYHDPADPFATHPAPIPPGLDHCRRRPRGSGSCRYGAWRRCEWRHVGGGAWLGWGKQGRQENGSRAAGGGGAGLRSSREGPVPGSHPTALLDLNRSSDGARGVTRANWAGCDLVDITGMCALQARRWWSGVVRRLRGPRGAPSSFAPAMTTCRQVACVCIVVHVC